MGGPSNPNQPNPYGAPPYGGQQVLETYESGGHAYSGESSDYWPLEADREH